MKKISIILFVMLVLITGCSDKKDKTDVNSSQINSADKKIEDIVKNTTNNKQGDVEFKDIKISELGATNVVTGKVINNSSKTKNFKLTLKMYNSSSDKLLGRVSTDISNLKAGETRNFEISIMGDYSTVDNFKVEVEDK